MVSAEDIRGKARGLREEVLQTLKELVEIESPSDRPEAVEKAAEKVFSMFAPFTRQKAVLGQEGKVFVVNPDAPLLFLGHLDTVHPVGTISRNPFRMVDNRVYGPGVLDMKGGIVALYAAARLLQELGEQVPPFRLVINSEEEIGSPRSLKHLKRAVMGSKICLGLEPAAEGGKLKTRRKGVAALKLEAWGREAHAGLAPEKGVNAIEEVINQASKIKEWALQRTYTFNLGVICGGSRANVVPGYCYALIDVRHQDENFGDAFKEYVEMLEPLQEGARVALSVDGFVPPLNPDDRARKLYAALKQLGEELDMEVDEVFSGGGSDASWVSHWGIPTVDGLGPEGRGEHTAEEHLYLDSLLKRVEFLALILSRTSQLLQL